MEFKKVNKIVIVFSLLLGTVAQAQISIGGKQSVATESSILDFYGMTNSDDLTDSSTANTKGIILPAVDDLPVFSDNTANNGTFVFDRNEKKVRMFEAGAWKDLSLNAGDDTAIVPNDSESVGQGAILGGTSSKAEGVLVLESMNKALVLPHIKNPHINVKSPYPGMMCYDTISNSLAVFDGVFWNYWK